ncbi:hypothetical protein HJ588_11815 [Flexivirga sp. ID2601S]|jgi:hypothetical protein|uniref:Uncharacterized protein n=1 Tax=Flexivirga aerilata TaxID=1656889 RepID=A0A849AIZ8_9MICO|nr:MULTISPECIES: hypothetical protein [Flexivirga]NNG39953.1 hypothetical protein [Flexivirga aerilata]
MNVSAGQGKGPFDPGDVEKPTQDVVTHLALLVPGIGPVTVDRLDGHALRLERRDVVLFSRYSGRLELLDPAALSQGYDANGTLTVVDDSGTRYVFPSGGWPGIRFTVTEARSARVGGNGSGGGR